MVSNHIAEEQSRQIRGSGRGGGSHTADHFAGFIHYNEDSVLPTSSTRQLSDQVHAHLIPTAWRMWNGLGETGLQLVAGFVALAAQARLHILLHVFIHFGPVV